MRNLKKILLVLLVLIIIIIAVIVILKIGARGDGGSMQSSYESESMKYQESDEIKKVDTESDYFTTSDCVQKYLNYLSTDPEQNVEEMINEDKIFIETEGLQTLQNKKEGIYNLLDKEYIQENGITTENILEKIKLYDKSTFQPTDMRFVSGYMTERYAVQGIIQNVEDESKKEEAYYIITRNKLQHTFTIYPLENNYKDITEVKIEKADEPIEKNNNNNYTESDLQENDIVQKYYTDYKIKSLNNTDQAYELLDEEYREKRFGDLEGYKQYIEKNRQDLNENIAMKYIANYDNDYREYICQDQFGELYTFKVTGVMEYTLILDTYTLENEDFLKKYNSSTAQNKVAMNIDKWVQMINTRDYKAAFNVLDESFRTTYFENDVNKFEEFMRTYFPYRYSIEFGDFSEEVGTYVQVVKMQDLTKEEDLALINERTFYMELGNGTDFVMSLTLPRH